MIRKDIIKICKNYTEIENYEKAIADKTQVWICHHRFETHNSDGEKRLVDIIRKELIALDLYYDRPPKELIFLSKSEHAQIHRNINKGRKLSEEHKKNISGACKGKILSEEHKSKISESLSGKKNPMYGKHLSLETRRKCSENSAIPKVAIAYKEYKANGGTLKWNEFQKEYKNNQIYDDENLYKK